MPDADRPSDEPRKQLGTQITASLDERLRDYARRHDVRIRRVVEESLTEFLEARGA